MSESPSEIIDHQRILLYQFLEWWYHLHDQTLCVIDIYHSESTGFRSLYTATCHHKFRVLSIENEVLILSRWAPWDDGNRYRCGKCPQSDDQMICFCLFLFLFMSTWWWLSYGYDTTTIVAAFADSLFVVCFHFYFTSSWWWLSYGTIPLLSLRWCANEWSTLRKTHKNTHTGVRRRDRQLDRSKTRVSNRVSAPTQREDGRRRTDRKSVV